MMSKKGIYKEILNLGIPSFLEALFNTFASIIDSKMVSVMGVTAISAVAADYAKLRVDLLKGPQGDIPRAYSQLNDDDLLYELLLSYYKIGNLRNQVNHASVDRAAVVAGGVIRRKDARDDLYTALDQFIKLYDTACKKTHKKWEPAILEPRRFRGYARLHELQPLETPTDLTQANNYVCQFDGKDVLIRINLLKPEADEGEPEEDSEEPKD